MIPGIFEWCFRHGEVDAQPYSRTTLRFGPKQKVASTGYKAWKQYRYSRSPACVLVSQAEIVCWCCKSSVYEGTDDETVKAERLKLGLGCFKASGEVPSNLTQ